MNILLINLYSKPNKKDMDIFRKIFKDKANLIIKRWFKKKEIINIIKHGKIDGIILSGSNFRIKQINNILIPKIVFKSKIPILGICFGFQYLVYYYSSLNNIKTFKKKKSYIYNKILKINTPFKIKKTKYFFNHHDYIIKLPLDWKISIKNKDIIYMCYDKNKNIGVQFHPESFKKSAKLFYSSWLKYIS
jgi:anthranilate/para-aminobenzoate synthase component II